MCVSMRPAHEHALPAPSHIIGGCPNHQGMVFLFRHGHKSNGQAQNKKFSTLRSPNMWGNEVGREGQPGWRGRKTFQCALPAPGHIIGGCPNHQGMVFLFRHGHKSNGQAHKKKLSTLRSPNMWGNEVGKEGAAWMAGKEILPMLSSGVRPKMPRIWLKVTHLCRTCLD